jgi:hypothetical protein
VRDFLSAEELTRYPNTGVILAASSEAETQEWSRWESGIFSHELRSGLLGGADADGDGRVTYAEAAAFVEAANSAVDVPRARLRVFSRPPSMRADVALLEASAFRGSPQLEVDAEHAGKYYIEDSRGVRVADLHSSREGSVRFALVGEGPFFLRTAEREAQIPARSHVEVRELPLAPIAAPNRGGIETTFRKHLFEIAYGPGFYRGIAATGLQFDQADTPLPEAPKPPVASRSLRPWAWMSLGTAAATAVAGGITYAYANQAHTEYERATTLERAHAMRDVTENRLLGARILFAVSGAAAAASATLFIVDWTRSEENGGSTVRMSSAVRAGGGGAEIFFSGRF